MWRVPGNVGSRFRLDLPRKKLEIHVRLSAQTCNLFKIDVQWPRDVCTSLWLPEWIYVSLQFLVSAICLAFQITHMLNFFPGFGWFYFIFLTNWTLVLETLTMLLLCFSTFWVLLLTEEQKALGDAQKAPGEAQKTPLLVWYNLSFYYYIIQPMSLVYGDPLLDGRQPALGSICRRSIIVLGTSPKFYGVDCAFVHEQPTMVPHE